MKKYICIDVGGTSIKHSIIDESGNILTQSQTDTEAKIGGSIILDKIKLITKGYINNYKEIKFEGVCVSTTGMVDPDKGSIIYGSPLTPGYTGSEIKKEIEEDFSILCEVENDVNCAGLGEMWLGAGVNYTSSVCMTIGTGIGGCIIVDNKLIGGATNSAGEIGYIKINNKDLQDVSATSVLVKTIQDKKNDDTIDGKNIFDLAKSGDKDCIDAIEYMIDNIAVAMSNIIYLINPQIIIIGGGISAQGEYLMPIINRSLSKYVHSHILDKTDIAFAKQMNNSGMLGALNNFMQKHK